MAEATLLKRANLWQKRQWRNRAAKPSAPPMTYFLQMYIFAPEIKQSGIEIPIAK